MAELERQVRVLFEQTGTTDWAVEARQGAAGLRRGAAAARAGEERKAAKLYMQETGAGIGEAVAALGELAREVRASRG